MVNYIVNFDEIREALKSILSTLTTKTELVDSYNMKSTSLKLFSPPFKGEYETTLSLEKDSFIFSVGVNASGFKSEDTYSLLVDGKECLTNIPLTDGFSQEEIFIFPRKTNGEVTIKIHNNSGNYSTLFLNVGYGVPRKTEG